MFGFLFIGLHSNIRYSPKRISSPKTLLATIRAITQPSYIFGQPRHHACTLLNALPQTGLEFVANFSQFVVAPDALFPHGHQSGPAEIGQVAGSRRLKNIECRDDVTDAKFARQQQVENAKPCSIGYSSKESLWLGARCSYHIRLGEYIGIALVDQVRSAASRRRSANSTRKAEATG